jgi:CHRD domain-containing protein/HYR domain-containing protein/type IX secretion system substrate protein
MIRALLKTLLATCSIFAIIVNRANATTDSIHVTLTGAQEVPANSSAGTGTLLGTYNDSSNVLKYTVTFSGLSANTIAAHFHEPGPPGVIAPVVFPATNFPTGVTSGTYTDSITLSAGQEDTLKMGLFYFNIHTTAHPGGEIRAQIFLQDASFVVPDVHCPADTIVSNTTGLCSASVAFAAIDTTGKPTSTLFYRIGTTAITSPFVFPVGVTKVTVIALNGAGLDSCSFNVTVRDTQPPVITCPANITQNNDPGKCGAIVTFAATATDNCSKATVTYDHNPGTFFDVGTTTVTATATDSSGNASHCTFTVTVNDVEPPVIHDLTATPRLLWPPNHKMKTVTINYTATDNCPGPINCTLSVTSNQPDNGHGDGNTKNDWMVVDDHHIQVRAERSGNGKSGRIYTTTVGCTDQHGNTAHASTTIAVPHSMVDITKGHGHHINMAVLNEEDPEKVTVVQVYPNPSRNYFTLDIQTMNNTDRISIRIIDITGRVVEARENLLGSQALRIGNNLRAGMYFVQIKQGDNVEQLKLLKQE